MTKHGNKVTRKQLHDRLKEIKTLLSQLLEARPTIIIPRAQGLDGLESSLTTINSSLETVNSSVQEVNENTDPAGGGSALVSGGSTVAASLISGGTTVAGALVSGGSTVIGALLGSGGDSAADILEDIETAVQAIEVDTSDLLADGDSMTASLDSIESVLETADGGVEHDDITSGQTLCTIRPAEGEKVRVMALRVKNAHASAARSFTYYFRESNRDVPWRFGASLTAGSEEILPPEEFRDLILTRNCYLKIVASGAADGNGFEIDWAYESIIGVTVPTFASS